jgi:P-type conjugative transfer protein TrbJ
MRKIIIALSVTLWLAVSAAPGQALTVACVNCSDNWTQQLERITSLEQLRSLLNTYQEAIQQTQQQIALVRNNLQQYENMLQNTKNLPSSLLNEVKGRFSSLARLTSQLNTQKGDIFAMSQVFDEVYPDLGLLKNMAGDSSTEEAWKKWSEESDRAAEATFQLTGSQLKDLADNSQALDEHIGKLLSTPEGQMEALQSGNSLAAIQVDELRQLRALMATNIQAVTQMDMKAEKREQLSREQRKIILDGEKLKSQYQDYR